MTIQILIIKEMWKSGTRQKKCNWGERGMLEDLLWLIELHEHIPPWLYELQMIYRYISFHFPNITPKGSECPLNMPELSSSELRTPLCLSLYHTGFKMTADPIHLKKSIWWHGLVKSTKQWTSVLWWSEALMYEIHTDGDIQSLFVA